MTVSFPSRCRIENDAHYAEKSSVLSTQWEGRFCNRPLADHSKVIAICVAFGNTNSKVDIYTDRFGVKKYIIFS
jgi:hypothetical protein